ncbi:MAG: outer membrane beta-barrel protein [Rikenellaceae bacterium]|jgi:hypothetical protein|nr:outer membrane beta-barrel protein [Rikenellaceae bacterium]
MKKILLLLLCASVWTATRAQAQSTGSVSGRVNDAATGLPLDGASVTAVENRAAGKPQTKKANASRTGDFTMLLPYGAYELQVVCFGYDTVRVKVSVDAPKVAVPPVKMVAALTSIEQVTVAGHAIRTSQKGDTVVYNASAFKVAKDADAEGLLSKMPGITVESDGSVTAQGETVQKVFVDGREFFGNDVTATIKNLPAEIIEKVETYNRLSDRAQLTGVDDGEGYKAINIVTKPSMRTGAFGKLYAGYGVSDKYMVGGTVNFFTGKHRLSLIGLLNNMNQQNFATEDILGVINSGSGGGGSRGSRGREGYGGGGMGNFMVSPMSGVSRVGSIGLNYSGQWKKKVDLQGSYFFNENRNYRNSLTDVAYLSRNDTTRNDLRMYDSHTQNFNHRFNAKLDWKIDASNAITIRPSLSFQSNNSNSVDSTSKNAISDQNGARTLLNTIRNVTEAKSEGYNASLSMMWVHRFATAGRALSIDITGSSSVNDRTTTNNNFTRYFFPARPDSLYRLRSVNNSPSYNVEGNIEYTEPLTDKSQLVFRYSPRYRFSDANRESYLGESTVLNDELSNIYNSGYLTQRIGPGYRFAGDKTTFIGSIYYQYSTLANDRTYPTSRASHASYDFHNALYFAMLNQTFNPQNVLRIYARSSTSNPSVGQLQNYVDMSNSQYVSTGNPALRPSTEHSLRMNYNRSTATKGRTFQADISLQLKQNDIVDNTIYAGAGGETIPLNDATVQLEPNAQFTWPINVATGSWSVRGGVSWGTPIDLIKSNINFNIGGGITQSPSYINRQKNLSLTQNLMSGVTIGSNISEKLDFTLSYNFGLNTMTNTITNRRGSDDTYWTQSAFGRAKWIAWAGFTLTANAAYSFYRGVNSNFTEDYCIVNMFVGKKLFKQMGELSVGVNDLLNQNKGFSRSVSAQSVSNVTNNVIRRYFSVQFVYNLRSFKGAGRSDEPASDTPRYRFGPGGQGGPGMMGPGGPGMGGPPPGGGFGPR